MGCGCGDEAARLQAMQAMQAMPNAATHINMEFIGSEQGTLTFMVQGRPYQGANNDFDKFATVLKEDVQVLLASGKWRIAPTPNSATVFPTLSDGADGALSFVPQQIAPFTPA